MLIRDNFQGKDSAEDIDLLCANFGDWKAEMHKLAVWKPKSLPMVSTRIRAGVQTHFKSDYGGVILCRAQRRRADMPDLWRAFRNTTLYPSVFDGAGHYWAIRSFWESNDETYFQKRMPDRRR